jgi:hypothetical protein
MKPPEFLRAGIFAAALVAGGLAGAVARAGVITLDVSGTMSPNSGFPGACSPTCTLGGDIVIDNSPGAANSGFVSADVTASGFSPTVGPFTIFVGVHGITNGLTSLNLEDSAADQLFLNFSTTTAGSLVGYIGGSLSSGNLNGPSVGLPPTPTVYDLSSGSLTAAVPEPPSILVLLSALAGLGAVLYTRRLPRRGLVPRRG